MIRFNYLHDAAPESFERLRTFRIPTAFVMPAYVAATSVLVVAVVIVLLQCRLARADEECRWAQARFEESQNAVANVNLERVHVRSLLMLDRRLRDVRGSGLLIANRFADIANHVPARAWLSSIAKAPDGLTIDGEAEGLAGLGDAVEGMIGARTVMRPRLLHAAVEDRSHGLGVLAFEVAVGERER